MWPPVGASCPRKAEAVREVPHAVLGCGARIQAQGSPSRLAESEGGKVKHLKTLLKIAAFGVGALALLSWGGSVEVGLWLAFMFGGWAISLLVGSAENGVRKLTAIHDEMVQMNASLKESLQVLHAMEARAYQQSRREFRETYANWLADDQDGKAASER